MIMQTSERSAISNEGPAGVWYRIRILTFTDKGFSLGTRVKKSLENAEKELPLFSSKTGRILGTIASKTERALENAAVKTGGEEASGEKGENTVKGNPLVTDERISLHRCRKDDCTLAGWTEEGFAGADALIYIGSAGIAVRAIAPFLVSKAEDPAVLVLDEGGKYCIPILSGHLGGANELAVVLSERLGAEAVLTTATDTRGIFAVDLWAKYQNCSIRNISGIKRVSGKLLKGETLVYDSEFSVSGKEPEKIKKRTDPGIPADFLLTIHEQEEGEEALICVPKILVIGVGCRKNTPADKIEAAFRQLVKENHLQETAAAAVCSINIKSEEAGLIEFCRSRGLPFHTFTADELRRVPGEYTHSGFVEKTVGVDNVCERSAVRGTFTCSRITAVMGEEKEIEELREDGKEIRREGSLNPGWSGYGSLICRKIAVDGVTMAAAIMPYAPDWSQKRN